MTVIQPRAGDFSRGLETTRDVRSSDPMAFRVFDNARTRNGHAKRRKGMALVHRFAASSDVMDFDGTNDRVLLPINSLVYPLSTRFTLEWLIYTDTIAATGFVVGGNTASAGVKLSHTSAGAITCVVTDSAAAQTTLSIASVSATTVTPIQLTRNGAALSLNIPGKTSATGTMSATNNVLVAAADLGAHNGADFYNGQVEFYRGFRTDKTSQADGWARLPDPRAPSVLFDYVMVPDANGYVMDRGLYGLHGTTSGSPSATRAPISTNPMPVLGMGMTIDNDASRQGYVRVGTTIYPVEF